MSGNNKTGFQLLVHNTSHIARAGSPRKAFQFMKGYLRFFPYSHRWLVFIYNFYQRHTGGDPTLDLVRAKFSRAYYSRQQTASARLEHLISHYRLLEASFSPIALKRLLVGESVQLGSLTGKSGEIYTLSLTRQHRFRFEGEMTIMLHRQLNAHMLAAVTFSIIHLIDKSIQIRIGGLQGSAGEEAKAEVVFATKDLSGLRPKGAVIDALYALSDTLRCTHIEATNVANHPLKDRNHHFVAMNDSFWEEFAIGRERKGAFILPLAQPTRTLEEVPSKRKKDWLARQNLKYDLCHQIQSALILLLAGS